MLGSAFLGVDGGGSGTEACVIRQDGRVIGKGSGGPGNVVYSSEGKAFLESVVRAVDAALSNAGIPLDEITLACVALSGAGRERDAGRARAALRSFFGETSFFVIEDTRAALAAAHGGSDGLILIAGTGSNCLGVSRGAFARSGGWGSLLGDEGSAYSIAVKGLRTAARASDGRSPATMLLGEFLKALGGQVPQDLIPLTHGLDRVLVAGLSRVVFGCAEAGDRVAGGILEEEARELSLMAAGVIERLGLREIRIGLTGGCFRNACYVDAVKRSLHTTIECSQPGATLEVFPADRSPSEGAAILAREAYARKIS